MAKKEYSYLGVNQKDYKKVMANLSSHRQSKRFHYILMTLGLENMKDKNRK